MHAQLTLHLQELALCDWPSCSEYPWQSGGPPQTAHTSSALLLSGHRTQPQLTKTPIARVNIQSASTVTHQIHSLLSVLGL